jgi:hypothetical protein
MLPLGQRAPAATIDMSFRYEVLDVANLKASVLVSTADGWPVAGDSKMTMSFELRGADPRISGTVTARVDHHFQLEYEAKGQTL